MDRSPFGPDAALFTSAPDPNSSNFRLSLRNISLRKQIKGKIDSSCFLFFIVFAEKKLFLKHTHERFKLAPKWEWGPFFLSWEKLFSSSSRLVGITYDLRIASQTHFSANKMAAQLAGFLKGKFFDSLWWRNSPHFPFHKWRQKGGALCGPLAGIFPSLHSRIIRLFDLGPSVGQWEERESSFFFFFPLEKSFPLWPWLIYFLSWSPIGWGPTPPNFTPPFVSRDVPPFQGLSQRNRRTFPGRGGRVGLGPFLILASQSTWLSLLPYILLLHTHNVLLSVFFRLKFMSSSEFFLLFFEHEYSIEEAEIRKKKKKET